MFARTATALLVTTIASFALTGAALALPKTTTSTPATSMMSFQLLAYCRAAHGTFHYETGGGYRCDAGDQSIECNRDGVCIVIAWGNAPD